jgi:hypothetical protein
VAYESTTDNIPTTSSVTTTETEITFDSEKPFSSLSDSKKTPTSNNGSESFAYNQRGFRAVQKNSSQYPDGLTELES